MILEDCRNWDTSVKNDSSTFSSLFTFIVSSRKKVITHPYLW